MGMKPPDLNLLFLDGILYQYIRAGEDLEPGDCVYLTEGEELKPLGESPIQSAWEQIGGMN